MSTFNKFLAVMMAAGIWILLFSSVGIVTRANAAELAPELVAIKVLVEQTMEQNQALKAENERLTNKHDGAVLDLDRLRDYYEEQIMYFNATIGGLLFAIIGLLALAIRLGTNYGYLFYDGETMIKEIAHETET